VKNRNHSVKESGSTDHSTAQNHFSLSNACLLQILVQLLEQSMKAVEHQRNQSLQPSYATVISSSSRSPLSMVFPRSSQPIFDSRDLLQPNSNPALSSHETADKQTKLDSATHRYSTKSHYGDGSPDGAPVSGLDGGSPLPLTQVRERPPPAWD
jgi:hypothetical protein